MKRPSVLLLPSLLLATMVANGQQASPQNTPCETWRAGVVDAWRIRALHSDPSTYFTPHTIFVANWFDADCPRIVYSITLEESGQFSLRLYIPDWAAQGAQGRRPRSMVEGLAPLVAVLPDSRPTRANGSVLLISYWVDGCWERREYDRASIPDAVIDVFKHLRVDLRHLALTKTGPN
jgi:hypothetical protein